MQVRTHTLEPGFLLGGLEGKLSSREMGSCVLQSAPCTHPVTGFNTQISQSLLGGLLCALGAGAAPLWVSASFPVKWGFELKEREGPSLEIRPFAPQLDKPSATGVFPLMMEIIQGGPQKGPDAASG